MESNQTSLYVAIYGAIVATAVAAWNIYREATNRGRLRVQLIKDATVEGGVIISDRLKLSVTNVGRKPVYLARVGYKRGNERTYFLTTAQSLPTKLEPGETFTDVSADAERFDGSRVRYFAAWDSVGRVYKVPRRQLRELQNKSGESKL